MRLAVTLAMVAGLAIIFAPPAAACDAMKIEFYPPSGPVGTEVTIYYWTSVNFDVYEEAGNGEGSRAGGVAANSTTFGGIPVSHPWGPMGQGSFTITVPLVPPGDYDIQVYDPEHYFVPTVTFTVTPGPVRHNPSTIVGHTLESLDGKYERVWGWDVPTQSWQVYDSSHAAQGVNDLQVLQRFQKIWIKVTEDDVVLNWRGTIYFLNKGWNLISALGDTYAIGNVVTVPAPA